ncbi:peptidoglycan DD-metalloendopeptidase family protein [Paenibacillus sp. NPDC058071]|uniref:peptidoglycan DD-metalloendopeptidase family protein n=1 Tax=Paenibacillus sp. NPDC058071 TaxID=3346326 RepID=UPI0036DBDC5F
MNTRDAVRKRRREKMKQLMERPPQKEERRPEPARLSGSLIGEPRRAEPVNLRDAGQEIDPEKQWKANPSPWMGWGADSDSGGGTKWPRLGETDGYDNNQRGWNSFRKSLLWRTAVAGLLFAAIWGMYRYDAPWSMEGRAFVKNALTDEIDFASAAAWYKSTFAGAPSFIPIFNNEEKAVEMSNGSVELPVVAPLQDAAIIRTFAELLDGVELAGASQAKVMAVETGRVSIVTEEKGGSVVVVEHANRRTSVYGNLETASVKANEWVEAGDPIGTLHRSNGNEPGLLLFKMKQNGIFIDPAGVIPLD